jgi:hypothetical protein
MVSLRPVAAILTILLIGAPAVTAEVGNTPPVFTISMEDWTVDEGLEVQVLMEAWDAEGDTLTWSDDTDVFDIDPTTGMITFTPLQAHAGEHTVTVTVSDGTDTDDITFLLTVRDVNDPPRVWILAPSPSSSFEEGVPIVFQAEATDPEGSNLTYTWSWDGSVFGNGRNVTLSYLPPGLQTVTLVVDDGSNQRTEEVQLNIYEDGKMPRKDEVPEETDEGINWRAVAGILGLACAVGVFTVWVARSGA